MKNALLIWNAILTLLVGFLLIKQLSGKGKSLTSTSPINDTAIAAGPFRIAYFEMDSVAAKFELVKELRAELATKEENINKELAQMARAIQERINHYQNLQDNNKLSPEQSDAANREIGNMQDGLKNRKQELDQGYNNYMLTRQNEIKTKIEEYLKEYNSNRNYTYIVSYEPGLFYYKDSAYNITAAVVKGLNEKYRPGKK